MSTVLPLDLTVLAAHLLEHLACAFVDDRVVALGERPDDRRLVRKVLVERTEPNAASACIAGSRQVQPILILGSASDPIMMGAAPRRRTECRSIGSIQ